MSTYLWIDLGTLSLPLLFSFHPRLRFIGHWRGIAAALAVVLVLFVPWDAWFTARDVWGFNPAGVTGIHLFGLPVEEVLFFLCIPYACLFTYHALGVLGLRGLSNGSAAVLGWLLTAALVLVVVFYPGRLYTSTALGGTALFLGLVQLWGKPHWLGRAFTTYLILLVPFRIVNGMLTGGLLPEAVVLYNDAENLGVRVGSIPVEDVFYGLLLFLLAVAVFETVEGKRPGTQAPA
jgi:lycopene cyclase domain-containing protein